MYGLLDRLEQMRTGISKKTRYGIIAILTALAFAFLFVGGGLSNNLMLGLIIVCIIAVLALALEPRKALCGMLVLAFFCVSLYLRVVPSYEGVFGGDWVKFGGNDPWYNMRLVENMVHNFPHRISYDAYTLFPTGQNVPFAPFFDFLLALVIWVIGVGHPDLQTIETVGAYFPAVLGALVVIPAYFIGRGLFSRTAGLLIAALVAIMPGEFFFRSMLGFTDHHIAEVLFSVTTVMFLIYAVKSARENEISFAHLRRGSWKDAIQNRDWRGLVRCCDWHSLRKPLLFAVLTGFFLGIYLLSWIGGLLIILVMFSFMVLQFTMDHLKGRSTDYLCIIGVPMFLVSLLMVVPYLNFLRFGHWAVAVLVICIIFTLVISGVSWMLEHRKMRRWYYPVAVVVLGLIGLGLFRAIEPGMLSSMIDKFGIFNPSVTQLTIMEAQPVFRGFNLDFSALSDNRLWRYFTTGLFVIPLAVLLMTYDAPERRKTGLKLAGAFGALILMTLLLGVLVDMPKLFGGLNLYYIIYGVFLVVYAYYEKNPGRVLLLIWSGMMLIAVMGQTRFAYYCAVNAAILIGYLCWKMPWILETIVHGVRKVFGGFSSRQPSPADRRKKRKAEKRQKARRESEGEIKKREGTRFDSGKLVQYSATTLAVIVVFLMSFYPTLRETVRMAGQPWGPNEDWHSAMVWLRENTPEPFGDPEAYYDLYEKPPAGQAYDYPDTAYGVMSWWDYGHWIERIGHRIPNANPFQKGIGGPRADGSFSYGASTFLTAQNESAGSKMLDELGSKYIAIDIETATTKFHTPATWSGQNPADYFAVYILTTSEGNFQVPFYGVKYYQSMCIRLYNFGTEAYVPNKSTYVISYMEDGGRRIVTDIANNNKPFPTYEEAKAFVDANPGYIIVGTHPFVSPVPLEKLEHYKQVYETEKRPIRWIDIPFHYVRIFEYTP